MDIVVKGRNVEVPDHYRQHVSEKLARIERYDQKLIRVDVELAHEKNPRQSASCQRVEITCKSRGPVIRSEAGAADFYSALDLAITKLQSRLSRVADRRRVHHGRRTPISVAAATAPTAEAVMPFEPVAPSANGLGGPVEIQDEVDDLTPGRIVRAKEHPAKPMSVDDALFQMELVGHDFYLFSDVETGRPSVVYRRKGYDYGVISLST
ncbi:MAG TPA: ribosome-associated translation inhibitor RaiA [Cryptosporangiaceae bacterium]|nr:ribosome-associated translation inhibitor RaiA [Cryptosporangiaceae bacterium]